jgi:hypothetical protein
MRPLVSFAWASVLALALGSPAWAAGPRLPLCEPLSDSLAICVNYLALNPHDGTVWGADGGTDARWLLRQENRGASAAYVYKFSNVIRGIHFLNDGTMFVSTDFDYVSPSPAYPCSLFRSIDAGLSFVPVKVLPTTAVVFTGLAHDHLDNLYVAEYGPRDRGLSNRVWRSADHGETWNVIFQAPDIDDIHIHHVAVDPYTGDLWVTYGHADYGTYRSRDGGQSWTYMYEGLAVAMAFTPTAIYLGEDRYQGIVTRYDRASETFAEVLRVSTFGPYGGGVSDMTVGRSGEVYVPFTKDPWQDHLPSLWFGHDHDWQLLQVFVEPQTGASQITPPDSIGDMFVMYHRIHEVCGVLDVEPQVVGGDAGLELRVTPNPARHMPLFVQAGSSAPGPAILQLLDVAGRRLFEREIEGSPGMHTVTVMPSAHVSPGVYFLRLARGRAQITERVTLVR